MLSDQHDLLQIYVMKFLNIGYEEKTKHTWGPLKRACIKLGFVNCMSIIEPKEGSIVEEIRRRSWKGYEKVLQSGCEAQLERYIRCTTGLSHGALLNSAIFRYKQFIMTQPNTRAKCVSQIMLIKCPPWASSSSKLYSP